MKIRIVAIGDELLDGHTRDSNTQELIHFIEGLGWTVHDSRIVRDTVELIRAEVQQVLGDHSGKRLVISTGGLGPTPDDRSRDVLAEAFGAQLVFSESRWQELLDWFKDRGRVPAECNRCQALHPQPGSVLTNESGTANGLVFEKKDKLWVALPGVPSEMRHLLPKLKQLLLEKWGAGAAGSVMAFRTRRLPEATLLDRLQPLEDLEQLSQPGFYPSADGVLLRLKLPPLDPDERLVREKKLRSLVANRLGEHLLCEGGEPLVWKVKQELLDRRQRLSLAESCTGGWLAKEMTDLPGSSAIFPGAVVAYENEVKRELLKVPADVLEQEGAVSAACVRAMATGVRELLNADWALAISGIAGPGGGSEDKPAGTVWLGLAGPEGLLKARLLKLRGTREQVRRRAAGQAWAWLYETMGGL